MFSRANRHWIGAIAMFFVGVREAMGEPEGLKRF